MRSIEDMQAEVISILDSCGFLRLELATIKDELRAGDIDAETAAVLDSLTDSQIRCLELAASLMHDPEEVDKREAEEDKGPVTERSKEASDG